MNLSALRLDTNLVTAPHWGGSYGGGGTYRTSGSHIALHHPRRVIVCSTKPVTPSPAAAVAEQTSEKLNRIGSLSQVSSVLGCQWGDEGKGKLVDILAKHFDIVARCQNLKDATVLEDI